MGGAAQARDAAGATVHQGALDYQQCVHVWGNDAWPRVIAQWFLRNGVPPAVANELIEVGSLYAPFIQYADAPAELDPGASVGGWDIVATPGHADGHVCLLRDRTLVAGDHLLPTISPAVGLYPDSRPHPLGDYLDSLERTARLGLRLALPGHGGPIEDPAPRCRALIAHHHRRLDETKTLLGTAPKTGYDVSLSLFPDATGPGARRFAVAETLSHLERLVHAGEAARHDDGQTLSYTDS